MGELKSHSSQVSYWWDCESVGDLPAFVWFTAPCLPPQVMHFILLRFYWFVLERGEGGRKRGRQTSKCERNIDWLPNAGTPTGDLACNPGMCPDWESNWWPFTLRDDASQGTSYILIGWLYTVLAFPTTVVVKLRNLGGRGAVCFSKASRWSGTWASLRISGLYKRKMTRKDRGPKPQSQNHTLKRRFFIHCILAGGGGRWQ